LGVSSLHTDPSSKVFLAHRSDRSEDVRSADCALAFSRQADQGRPHLAITSPS
jgi:hypothetical protein